MAKSSRWNTTADLLDSLRSLRREVRQEADEKMRIWRPWLKRKSYLHSAENLAAYLSFRSRDFRDYQDALQPLGLSAMAHCEAHVLQNLDAVLVALHALERLKPFAPFYEEHQPAPISSLPQPASLAEFQRSRRALNRGVLDLFGRAHHRRRSRIVVTLPSEAGDDARLVYELARQGADAFRLNCAHDTLDIWSRMVEHVHKAESKLGRPLHILVDLPGPKIRTGRILALRRKDKLDVGDMLWLVPESEKNEPHGETSASFDLTEGVKLKVTCTLPAALTQAKKGHRVFFDDGQISGRILLRKGKSCLVQIESAPEGGKRLKADKGINLPDTECLITAPTPEDLEVLPFVMKHAHMLGFSFVQGPEDVLHLQEEMKSLVSIQAKSRTRVPAIVAKIETARSIAKLPEILVAAAGHSPAGVMIARGDLAVEIGFLRMAEMQEELLWIAEAAHLPVIWATQVLESHAKRGLPSRPEMTDAAMSVRADAVMLNKGPFMAETVALLGDILARMEAHQLKKTPRLRALKSWT